jgi:hypothetical protein
VRGFERLLLVDGVQNLFEHTIEIPKHFIVPEAQNEITARIQVPAAARIRCFLCIMLAAIELDDQLRIRAAEVDNEPVERFLSAEFPSIQPSIAQSEPKSPLGIGLTPSQATCCLN